MVYTVALPLLTNTVALTLFYTNTVTVHNVLFVQYDSPVSKIDPCLLQGYIRHGAIIMPVSTSGLS